MLYHVVVAMMRSDWSEAIVSLNRDLDDARQVACRIAVVLSQKFLRCRIKQMELTRSQVEAICEEWGRDDARDGEPLLTDKLPKSFAAAYQRGYRASKNLTSRDEQA